MKNPDSGFFSAGETDCGPVVNEFDQLDLDSINQVQHWVSFGKWSLYQLAEYILQHIGPATLHLATWSISELSARKICDWLASGALTEVTGLVDARTENRHEASYQLCRENFTRMRISPVHAKVAVFYSKTHQVLVAGSANWTENPRIEAGMISTSKIACASHTQWISDLVNQTEHSL